LPYAMLNSFKTAGGHPSSTGAPGEPTCANAQTGCHSNASVNYDTTNIVNTLIFPTADSSYAPGMVYDIILKTQKSGVSKFGFEMVALKRSTKTNIGSWIITEPDRTQKINGTGNLSSRKYITHTANGTSQVSPGLGQWAFQWEAPLADEGEITFYYATNTSNNDGKSTGDELWLSAFTIHPQTNSIDEWLNTNSFIVVFDKESNELKLQYFLNKPCEIYYKLVNTSGQITENGKFLGVNFGMNTNKVSVPSSMASGIYFFTFEINQAVFTKKIIINK
jgi:hypothetical protein